MGMNRRTITILSAAALMVGACSAQDDHASGSGGDIVESTSAPILGSQTTNECPYLDAGGLCPAIPNVRMITAHRITRIAISSPAFAECVNRTMRYGSQNSQNLTDSVAFVGLPNSCGYRDPPYVQTGYGPYVSCEPNPDPAQGGSVAGGENNDDAAWNELIDRQLARALSSLRINTDLVNTFVNASGNGAVQGGYDTANARADINWQGPIVAFTLDGLFGPVDAGSGFIPSIVHEAMHDMGYDHGCWPDEENDTDHGNCGRDPVTWHPDRTMNNIAAFCAKEVLLRSKSTSNSGCGTEGSDTTATLKTCPENGMFIVSSFAASSTTPVPCHCVPDVGSTSAWGTNAAIDRFGSALAVGDYNGDGFRDLAVGAPEKDLTGGSKSGAVFIFRGSKAGLHHWRSFGPSDFGLASDAFSYCGSALAAGDFNGDGASDLAVGCLGAATDDGRVAVLPGCAAGCANGLDGLQNQNSVQLSPGIGGDNSRFGHALASGRIVGSDARDDLAVGAPGWSSNSGRVNVYAGSGLFVVSATPSFTRSGTAGASLGHSLAFGNVQSTSTSELIIGAPFTNGSRGAVHVSTATTMTALTTPTLPATARFGTTIASGNVFSTAHDDILITSPGELKVYRSVGATLAPSAAEAILTFTTAPGMPSSIALAPGASHSDVIVGMPGISEAGRFKSDGSTLASVEWLGQSFGTKLWSQAHDPRDGGYCQKLNDINNDVPCPQDGLNLAGTGLGTAVASGDFGHGLQYVLGAPSDSVDPIPLAAGAVYVRRGMPKTYAPNELVEPQEYRLDQIATVYGGVKDVRNFAPSTKWNGFFCEAGEQCFTGDADGDGNDDIFAFSKSNPGKVGDAWVALSDGTGAFGNPTLWNGDLCAGNEVCAVGDVDNNGTDDMIAFVQSATSGHQNHVHVVRCQGCPREEWDDFFCIAGQVCGVGNVDGTGGDDIVAFDRPNFDVWVGRSNGSTFNPPEQWHGVFCAPGQDCLVGDVNGDNRADIVAFTKGTTNSAVVALSNGIDKFGDAQRWHDHFCVGSEVCRLRDVNGDGFADAVAFVRDSSSSFAGDVWVALSNRYDFGPEQKWHDDMCRGSQICQLGDVNEDKRADVVVFTMNTASSPNDVNVALSVK
jgi:hypothetical protein